MSTSSTAHGTTAPSRGLGDDGRSVSRTEKWGRRSPRRFSLTRQGRGYVFVTVGVGVAAVNTGNNLLYLILGLLLSLLLVSGTLSDLALYRIRVGRRLPPRWFVGRESHIDVTVRNLKERLPSYSLELREEEPRRKKGKAKKRKKKKRDGPPPPTGDVQWGRAYSVHLRPGEAQTLSYGGVPTRRGVHQLASVLVTTRYPFGLIEKVTRRGEDAQILVYPEVVPMSPPALPIGARGEVEAGRKRGRGVELVGVREARQGDAHRDIHWRKSASRGELIAVERADDEDRRVLLRLDNGRPEGATPDGPWHERFERDISRCASLAVAAIAAGITTEVETRSGRSPTVDGGGAPDPILTYLAKLDAVTLDGTGGDWGADEAAFIHDVGAHETEGASA